MAKKKPHKDEHPQDGRGKRPRDANQLAQWIVEQAIEATENQKKAESPNK
jgi:CxxC motif-containing protein (DUF1111 family)